MKEKTSSTYTIASIKDKLWTIFLAVPILLIDQWSKYWIIERLELGESFAPIPAISTYFRFYHLANTGTVFGLFEGMDWIFALLALITTVGLVWFNWTLPYKSRLLRITLGLILGGAIGNLLDRFLIGHVTDFVDIDLSSIIPIGIADWYIFNIADLAIVVGLILYGYITFFRPEQLQITKDKI